MAYKTAKLLIDGPNKTWVEILVRYINDGERDISMTWQRIGVIKSTGSFSGDYNTANYPALIVFKDPTIGNVFTLSGFQNDPDPRFPFKGTSNGEGTCLVSNFEVHQGSLTWKVIEINPRD